MLGERAPPTEVSSDRSLAAPACLECFALSLMYTISLSPCILPNGNDFALSDRNGCQKSGVSHLPVLTG